ncbi:MAG: hypothetical protein WD535_01800 [Thermaerobacterales bacterium]
MNDWIPLDEAAAQIKITPETLRRSIELGLVRGRRHEGAWQVVAEELQGFWDDQDRMRKLPLQPADFLCADCGELMSNCAC